MFDSIKRKPLFQITNNFIQIKKRARQLKKDDHLFQKMRKKIFKFSPEKIYALQKAYLPDREDKFNNKMHVMIHQFAKEVVVFFQMYGQVFKDLKELIIKHVNEHNECDKIGGQLVKLTENYAEWNELSSDGRREMMNSLSDYRVNVNDFKSVYDYVKADYANQSFLVSISSRTIA
jgi:hypothetical protein